MNDLLKLIILLAVSTVSFCRGGKKFHPDIRLEGCPALCDCFNTFCKEDRSTNQVECSGVLVNCFQKGLSEIPDGIPRNVTGLLLSNNNITYIDFDDFAKFTKLSDLMMNDNGATRFQISKPLRKLKRLSLRDNKIAYIPARNLTKMKSLEQLYFQHNLVKRIRGVRFPKSLEVLDLSDNNIIALPAKLFPNAKNLRILKLARNKINYLSSDAFRNAPMLQTLNLEGNDLRSLQKDAFLLLQQAWYLNLEDNAISSIHKHAFRMFGAKNPNHHQIDLSDNKIRFISSEDLKLLVDRKQYYSIQFGGNPLFCDCNLLKLREEAEGLLADPKSMVCESPTENAGKSLSVLTLDDCCF